MTHSVFKEVASREVSGYHTNNISLAKRIPDSFIEYFECRTNQAFHLHSMLDIISPPFACDFSPVTQDLLLIAQEDGLVHLYNTYATGSNAYIRDYEAHSNAVFDVKWLSSGAEFLTASGDQSIRLINAEQNVIQRQFFGHTMSVRSLALMPGDPNIFASASRDGSIRLWDTRMKSDTVNYRGTPGTSSVGLISQCHLPNWSTNATDSCIPTTRRQRTPSRKSSSDAQSVTSVLFMNGSTLLSAGSTDGSIKLWDLRKVFSSSNLKKTKPKFVLPYRGVSQKRSGYSDLQLDSLRTRLYANCLDNVIYEYDLTSPSTSPIFAYAGHHTDSFYIKLDVSPDDNYLICGSSDKRAHIYTIGHPRQQPIVLSGHNGEVSVPRWCRTDPTRIVTLSDDSRAFVWTMFPARRNILPQPGELAGMAERISPSKSLMSPSEQSKRILRSPRSSSRPSAQPSDIPTTPHAASARRRQSNIRCFLEAISPPALNQPPPSHAAIPQAMRNRSTAATLPETLRGVVQRFPALATGVASSIVSTPPAGCYTPIKSASRRLIDPDRSFSDNSDIENISPNHGPSEPFIPSPPFEHADSPSFLTHSPIIHSQSSRLMMENPPYSPQNRSPFAPQQTAVETPPPQRSRSRAYSPSSVTRKRSSPSPDASRPGYLSPVDSNQPLIIKRRRLTVCTTNESPIRSAVPPGTPTPNRRRRMTTMNLRLCRPITSFFKSDNL